MLKLEDYVPIDIEHVKKKREKIYNIPNSGGSDIERSLKIINNKTLPNTLRIYQLNHLPYCVIDILNNKNE